MANYVTLSYSKKKKAIFSMLSGRIIFTGKKKECKQLFKTIKKQKIAAI